MTVKGVADTVYAFRFLRKLVQNWTSTEAYKLGIIDENGKTLKKGRDLQTSEEKNAYTYFHRLVFNIKRLLEKLPFGKTKIASFATALFLIKEHGNLNDADIEALMSSFEVDFDINEDVQWFINEDNQISPGTYTLCETIVCPKTAEPIANIGDKVIIENVEYIDIVLGVHIFEAKINNHTIYINQWDIKR